MSNIIINVLIYVLFFIVGVLFVRVNALRKTIKQVIKKTEINDKRIRVFNNEMDSQHEFLIMLSKLYKEIPKCQDEK